MWIAKPVYESLPYFYLVAGLLLLTAAMYVTHGYWPTVCFTTGCICLVAGVVIQDCGVGAPIQGELVDPGIGPPDQDLIGMHNRGKPVRDHQRRPVAGEVVQRRLYVTLGLGIECRRGLVEDQNRRILQQGAGNGQALALSPGKAQPVLAHQRVEA